MTYTTLNVVKQNLGADTAADDTILNQKIAAAQAEIDRYTGRTFEAVTATRYYNENYWGFDGKLLLLDSDLLTVTTLTNGDGDVIPSSGYWLEPQNQAPYTCIRLKSAYDWTIDEDGQISIAGTWGYSATAPANIVEACTELTLYLYRLKDVSNLTATTLPGSGDTPIPIDLPKHVKAMLANYRSLI